MKTAEELVARILLRPEALKKLQPSESIDVLLLGEIRVVSDLALSGGKNIGDPGMFALVRGGLLYLLDAIDEAHVLFQDVASDIGAYWHGMAHRREGDFDNARYWFRRSGTLPVFDSMHRAASQHSADMARQFTWDPYLFANQCEQARFGANELHPELAALQRIEFEVLFEYCLRKSALDAGRSPAK